MFIADFDAMAELVNPKNIPAAQQAELEAYLREVGPSGHQTTVPRVHAVPDLVMQHAIAGNIISMMMPSLQAVVVVVVDRRGCYQLQLIGCLSACLGLGLRLCDADAHRLQSEALCAQREIQGSC